MFELIVNHFLGNLPTWIWPFAAGAGFGCYVLLGIVAHFPQLKIYSVVGRPIALVVCIVSIFLYGGAGVLAIQQQALQEANQRVAIAEQASADANKQLADNMANAVNNVKNNGNSTRQIIIQDKLAIDADCNKINDRAWNDYNRAVSNIANSGSVTVKGLRR